jgi:hypothetical protein
MSNFLPFFLSFFLDPTNQHAMLSLTLSPEFNYHIDNLYFKLDALHLTTQAHVMYLATYSNWLFFLVMRTFFNKFYVQSTMRIYSTKKYV